MTIVESKQLGEEFYPDNKAPAGTYLTAETALHNATLCAADPEGEQGENFAKNLDSLTEDEKQQIAQLYMRGIGTVRHIVSGALRDPADIRDVSHDVFIRAMRSLRQFKGGSDIMTWLRVIAHNELKRELGRRLRERMVPFESDSPELAEIDTKLKGCIVSPEDAVVNAELGDHLNDVIEDIGLSPKAKKLLSLRYLHDMDLATAAKHLGMNEGAAKAMASRSLKRIRERISQDVHFKEEPSTLRGVKTYQELGESFYPFESRLTAAVMYICEHEGKSTLEASRILGISPNAALKRYNRTIEKRHELNVPEA